MIQRDWQSRMALIIQARKLQRRAFLRGDVEQARAIGAVLDDPALRDEFISQAMAAFQQRIGTEAIGDGQFLDRLLTWLTQEGGLEAIIKLITTIFTLGG